MWGLAWPGADKPPPPPINQQPTHLRDEPDKLARLPVVEPPVGGQAAPGGRVPRAQDVEEGGLPAAGGAHDGQHLWLTCLCVFGVCVWCGVWSRLSRPVVCVYVCMYVPARGARGPRCRRAASSSRPSSGGAAPRTCVGFVYMCKCIGLYKRMFVCGSLDRSNHPSIEPSIRPRIHHALNTHAPDVPEGDGGGRRTLQRIAAAVAIRHAPPGRATRAARAAHGGSGGGRGGGGVCFCFVFAGCVGMDGVGVR